MLPSQILRAAQAPDPKPSDLTPNPYKAKQTWPPDFTKLSDRHQFSLERRYRRRAKLKWARPRFMVATKLAQWIGCISIGVYGVLFMDWGNDYEAFKDVRTSFWDSFGGGSRQRGRQKALEEGQGHG